MRVAGVAGNRYKNSEAASLADLAMHFYAATVAIYRILYDAQPQAGAGNGANVAGTVKALKQVWQVVFRDTDALVGYGEHQLVL